MFSLMIWAAAMAASGEAGATATRESPTRPTFTITGWAAAPAPATSYLRVTSAGDVDGDGLLDDGVLGLVCADGRLSEAHYVKSPRDSASGQATGKRQHKPVTFVKEWGAASPQLAAAKPTYDLKTSTKARTQVWGDPHVDWVAVDLSNGEELCTATTAINNSHSNVK